MKKIAVINILLIAMSIVALASCDPVKKSATGARGGASSGTSLAVAVPDRGQFLTQVLDIRNRMNGYRLIIAPKEPNCPGGTQIDQIGDYADGQTVSASVQPNCDYYLVFALGYKDGQTAYNWRSNYFKNDAPRFVMKEEPAGKSIYAVSNLAVNLQPDGAGIGLKTLAPITTSPVLPNTGIPGGPIVQNPVIGGISPAPVAPLSPIPNPAALVKLPSDKEFSLKNSSGTSIKLSDKFKGKYLLIDFSASTCGPCISMAEQLTNDQDFQKKVDGSVCSVVWLVDSASAWQSAVGVDANSFVGKNSFAVDGGYYKAFEAFDSSGGGMATPTTFLIDPTGKVVDTMVGGEPAKFEQLCKAGS